MGYKGKGNTIFEVADFVVGEMTTKLKLFDI